MLGATKQGCEKNSACQHTKSLASAAISMAASQRTRPARSEKELEKVFSPVRAFRPLLAGRLAGMMLPFCQHDLVPCQSDLSPRS